MRQALILGITAVATVVASNVHADDVHADIGGITAVALVVTSNVHVDAVHADDIEDAVSIQLGKGMQFSDDGAVFPSYQLREIEYHFSTWDFSTWEGNSEIRLSNPLSSKLGLSWTPGVAPVANQTELLGTHGQSYNHFRFRDHDDRRLKPDVGRLHYSAVDWSHYSNDKRILDHSYGPNLNVDANDAKFGPTWLKTF